MAGVFDAFRAIRAFAFDVDGVMTDGRLHVTETGELLREMSVRDGYALQLAIRLGYRVVVITGGASEGVRLRLARLGVEDYYSGVEDKAEVLHAYIARHSLTAQHVLYMGDDLPDLAPMQLCGLACAPEDATPEVLAQAAYVSPHAGGRGCVRDVIERVLKLNQHWPNS